MRRIPFLAALAALALGASPPATATDNDNSELLARAVLPARTFAPGPPSGTLLGPGPINGVPVPVAGQPVQGFSAALPAGHGRCHGNAGDSRGSLGAPNAGELKKCISQSI